MRKPKINLPKEWEIATSVFSEDLSFSEQKVLAMKLREDTDRFVQQLFVILGNNSCERIFISWTWKPPTRLYFINQLLQGKQWAPERKLYKSLSLE